MSDRTRRGPGGRLDPDRFRLAISFVLAAGVTVSAALVGFGLLTGIAFGWNNPIIGGGGGSQHPPGAYGNAFQALLELRPIGFAQVGLLVLLGTPVARVAASLVGFALEGDRLYVVVSGIVLTVLLASILLAH